jgi:hypothetical protein
MWAGPTVSGQRSIVGCYEEANGELDSIMGGSFDYLSNYKFSIALLHELSEIHLSHSQSIRF